MPRHCVCPCFAPQPLPVHAWVISPAVLLGYITAALLTYVGIKVEADILAACSWSVIRAAVMLSRSVCCVPVLPCGCSHAQFKDWFSNPLTGAVEAGQEVSGQLVERLHGVLRPFLLRWGGVAAVPACCTAGLRGLHLGCCSACRTLGSTTEHLTHALSLTPMFLLLQRSIWLVWGDLLLGEHDMLVSGGGSPRCACMSLLKMSLLMQGMGLLHVLVCIYPHMGLRPEGTSSKCAMRGW